MAVVPFAWAVTTPLAGSIEATVETLDFQDAALMVAEPIVAGMLVKFTVVPFVVVPMTMSPAV
jgi:hypothetical protein